MSEKQPVQWPSQRSNLFTKNRLYFLFMLGTISVMEPSLPTQPELNAHHMTNSIGTAIAATTIGLPFIPLSSTYVAYLKTAKTVINM